MNRTQQTATFVSPGFAREPGGSGGVLLDRAEGIAVSRDAQHARDHAEGLVAA